MYELCRMPDDKNTVSINTKFGMDSLRKDWPMFAMVYVGKTTMSHTQIKDEGIYRSSLNTASSRHLALSINILITHLFVNNCQNFAKYLLETICPNAYIHNTIEMVLLRFKELLSSINTNHCIPGAYPQSISTYDSL
jgi:hypothetical protein